MKVPLVRVCYGRKDTPVELREYKIDGKGAVGTIAEFKKHLPDCEFEVIDSVEDVVDKADSVTCKECCWAYKGKSNEWVVREHSRITGHKKFSAWGV
jgi:hypothetical protein